MLKTKEGIGWGGGSKGSRGLSWTCCLICLLDMQVGILSSHWRVVGRRCKFESHLYRAMRLAGIPSEPRRLSYSYSDKHRN